MSNFVDYSNDVRMRGIKNLSKKLRNLKQKSEILIHVTQNFSVKLLNGRIHQPPLILMELIP